LKFHLITLVCALGALGCYSYFGLGGGAVIFLGLGLILEVTGYIRVFLRPRRAAISRKVLIA
jgi:hypothetical protein